MQSHQLEPAMEAKKWGIGAKILVVGIVVAVGWLATLEIREAARINRLAALPPCNLAVDYVEWRLAFEDQHAASETEASEEPEFVRENEVFEQAVRQAREDVQSPVLEALENLTAVDSERWIREEGDIDAFVQIMLAECREEVEHLMGDAQR